MFEDVKTRFIIDVTKYANYLAETLASLSEKLRQTSSSRLPYTSYGGYNGCLPILKYTIITILFILLLANFKIHNNYNCSSYCCLPKLTDKSNQNPTYYNYEMKFDFFRATSSLGWIQTSPRSPKKSSKSNGQPRLSAGKVSLWRYICLPT